MVIFASHVLFFGCSPQKRILHLVERPVYFDITQKPIASALFNDNAGMWRRDFYVDINLILSLEKQWNSSSNECVQNIVVTMRKIKIRWELKSMSLILLTTDGRRVLPSGTPWKENDYSTDLQGDGLHKWRRRWVTICDRRLRSRSCARQVATSQ